MRRVLVVDDELTLAEVVELALSMHGFDVSVAHDGRDALAHIATHRPDAVLSDVMMPYVGGLELARTIHETPSLRGIPVILMSASGQPPPEARNTYSEFLSKPFDVAALVRVVERVLSAATQPAVVTNGDRRADRP